MAFSNEQIAHDLAVALALQNVEEYIADEKEDDNLVDEYSKAVYIANSYKTLFPDILKTLNK